MDEATRVRLQLLQRDIALTLEMLEGYFQPQCMLTFIMRNPDEPDVNLVMTKDDLEEVVKILNVRIEKKKGVIQ